MDQSTGPCRLNGEKEWGRKRSPALLFRSKLFKIDVMNVYYGEISISSYIDVTVNNKSNKNIIWY